MRNPADILDATDTALWVAALRAAEARRPDAIFQDSLAELLAGDRGPKIARSFSPSSVVGWGVVMRTAAIDRLIGTALACGIDTVVNLGAGMDTRPHRLPLPTYVRWVEIDFPALIHAKNTALRGHAPRCQVERIGLDLRDRPALRSALMRSASKAGSTLLIAEGVIPYLSNAEVRLLATDLHDLPSYELWILDFDNAGNRGTPIRWRRRLSAAPMLFRADDWFEFFAACAWRPRTVITSGEESERLTRPCPLAGPSGLLMHALPRAVRRKVLDASGAVILERSLSASA